MVLVMHSYGSLSVSLSSSQEDEPHIKMSTRKDLFHFLNEGSCVWSELEMMGATLDKMVLFSARWHFGIPRLRGKEHTSNYRMLSSLSAGTWEYMTNWVLFPQVWPLSLMLM